MTVTKKIAIFLTEHSAEWTHPHGTYDEMVCKLLDATKPRRLPDGDFTYRVFDIYNGEIPTAQEMTTDEYMGIFITGSRYDSFAEDIDWINRLKELLVELLDETKTYPPIVGVCFGHQVIACALGGKVNRNPVGFEGGVVPIDLNEHGMKLFGQRQLNLSMLHNDVVLEKPKDVSIVNWGSSSRCSSQGFYKPTRLLTFQGHPEFVSDVAKRGWEKTLQDPDAKFSEGQVEEMTELTSTLENHGYSVAANTIWRLFTYKI